MFYWKRDPSVSSFSADSPCRFAARTQPFRGAKAENKSAARQLRLGRACLSFLSKAYLHGLKRPPLKGEVAERSEVGGVASFADDGF